jgi:hypothetical protein
VGDYLLAVKGNQPALRAAVGAAFAAADAAGFDGVRYDQHTTTEVGHGRREERSVSLIYNPLGLPPGWPDAASVVSVVREWVVGGEATTTVHYYLSSYAGTAEVIAAFLRGHGGSRTGCTGYWKWRSGRTRAGRATSSPARTWPCCGESRCRS